MKCLVTGGCGFIGSHVVDVLLEAGHRVHVIDNLETGTKENCNSNATYTFDSIANRSVLESCFETVKPDWVFHLAALPRIMPSFDEPEYHHTTNVVTIFPLLELSKKYNVNMFINSSSSAVYGNPTELPTSESAAITPLSPYALQKYTAEQYVHILSKYLELPHVSLRYFNPYGPRSFNPKNPQNAYSSVVGIFLDQRKRGAAITVTGTGEQERDFIHVRDVAKANLFVAEHSEKSNGNIYNVGAGATTSILDLANMLSDTINFIPARLGEARITLADITALTSLGWTTEETLNDYIQKELS
jgi:UDP-glucose 4-epimerase